MADYAQARAARGLESRSSLSLIALTADIVSAYVTNNSVRPGDLVGLITSVHQTLGNLVQPTEVAVEPSKTLSPAQIRRSITPDGIISFIDGRSYKTMKRHLRIEGLDPRTYRERFGLPGDYPMVSANYSATRSALALSIGLGQIRKKTATERAASPTAPKERGRRRKVETTEAAE